MKFLKYEKSIFERSNTESLLVIAATGICLDLIIQETIRLYQEKYTLTIILGIIPCELINLNSEYITDISKMTIAQRCISYKKGGVFHGSIQILLMDFVNENIEVSKISCIIVLEADKIEEYNAEAFILYIFKEKNSIGIIKAFSNKPLGMLGHELFEYVSSLCISKIALYPRFHCIIKESFIEAKIEKLNIKQTKWIEDISILILEMVKKLKGVGGQYQGDPCEMLIYNRRNYIFRNFENLLNLVFTCDLYSVLVFYENMIEEEKIRKINNSWIFSEECNLLLETCKLYYENLKYELDEIKEDEIKEDEIKEDEIKEDEIKEDEIKEDEIKEDEIKEDEIKEDEIKEDEIKEDEIKEIRNKKYKQINLLKDNKLKKMEIKIYNKNDNETIITNKYSFIENEYFKKMIIKNLKIKKIFDLISQNLNKKIMIIVKNSIIEEIIKNIFKEICICLSDKLFNIESDFDIIILLNYDLKIIRSIEYYVSRHKECRIIILAYKNSIEEQIYLVEIKEEKNLFERLIEERANIPLQFGINVIEIDNNPGLELNLLRKYNSVLKKELNKQIKDTLKNLNNEITETFLKKNKKNNKISDTVIFTDQIELPDKVNQIDLIKIYKKFYIIVDSREMRSKLPFYLYKAQNFLEIKVLDIGDYICNGMCIERKSIEDFKISLQSGRLYSQARKLVHNYFQPFLLIEFPNNFPTLFSHDNCFNFEYSIISKFCIFLIHFPCFKVFWSNNHMFSIKLIRDIQEKPSSDLSINGIDPVLYELLLSIPGINNSSFKAIFQNFKNLDDLAFATLDRLEKYIDVKNAKSIYDFFRINFN